MLTIHHLNCSQSERAIWLCEELDIPYEIVHHQREATFAAPESLRSLPGNDLGTAPFMQDGEVGISESGAVVEYIIHKYGGGRLALPPSHPRYADYLFWFHYVNAGLQSVKTQAMIVGFSGMPADNLARKVVDGRVGKAFRHLDGHLAKNKFLVGEEFTAADIMILYTIGTGRYYTPMSYAEYPNIVRYLEMIGERDAFRRAMAKGDEGMELLLGADAPEKSVLGF